jgi:hypothetical protein
VAKSRGEEPITHLQIFAERCTGSNYLRALIEKNCFLETAHFGHKHYPPWFSLPQEGFRGRPHHYSFEGNEKTLFVMVVRDPYDWIRSYHSSPYGALRTLGGLPFSQFIRATYHFDPRSPDYEHFTKISPHFEKDPQTGKPFPNVLKMRTAKTKNMLLIQDKVENFYLIRYEVACEYPEEVLQELASLYGLSLSPTLISIDTRRDNGKVTYTPKKYPPIDFDDLEFINSQLDWELERWLGYQFKREVS